MLKQEEIEEIKKNLEKSQNPLFFFDNDADGLCSFIILQRAIGRGKGVQIKTYPSLSKKYIKKIDELKPDMIFILDKAEVSEEFIEEVFKRNLEIIWIDHHKSTINQEIIKKIKYFNTYPESEPVTYIAQKIFNKKQDLWLAMIGCISDVYSPDFEEKFQEQYPELYKSGISAFEALHTTEIGKFSKMLNFGLMNSTTNVIKLIKYLIKAKGPYDLLEENFQTREFHKRFRELNNEMEKQIKKAKDFKKINPQIIYFSYSGETSMSAIVSNQLYFENQDKLIIVAFKKPEKINLSIRGKSALEFTKMIIKKIGGATGGGHKEATGAMIPPIQIEKLEELIKNFEKKIIGLQTLF